MMHVQRNIKIDGISNEVIIRCQKILIVSISFLDAGFQFLGAVE